MNSIILQQPRRILFGSGTFDQTTAEVRLLGGRRVFILTTGFLLDQARGLADNLKADGIDTLIFSDIETEPDIALFKRVMAAGRAFGFDSVVGLGGGSVLDLAKLAAAFNNRDQEIQETFGIGLLNGRTSGLICIPTTSGTGSEVSPNAILLDENDQLKKGVVSPYLVPDAAIVDPLLTLSVPPAVTAATGLDAMVHCMEAYANLHAHPTVDLYALEGIRQIAPHLLTAVSDGTNRKAREALSLGSLYGGLCLGPVNTAAVHALSYPLGGEFHVPHGVSNTLLLPHVFAFNLDAAPERYATIARILGAADQGSELATAQEGIRKLVDLSVACGLPQKLREVGVKETDLAHLATESMKVTRLLKNNPKPVSRDDAEAIYRAAF